MKLQLIVGDRNLSSWSMRPWLVLKQSGMKFSEIVVRLDRPDTAKKIRRYSPSGRIPVLIHEGVKIWDSLSISEYVAELAPDKRLWPEQPKHRAIARSLCTEMHSGFQSLRAQMSMDIQLRSKIKHLQPQTLADIKRVLHIWDASIKTNGGPFLFGEFGIADAFYAPIVCRFKSYGIDIRNRRALKYMDNVLNHPPMREWLKLAAREKPFYPSFG